MPRRELFDIRAQLMAEDGQLSSDSIAGLSTDDIIPSFYEGGFKTWECSLDLSAYIEANVDVHYEGSLRDTTIIEVSRRALTCLITYLQFLDFII